MLNGPLSGSSSFAIPADLKMGERVKQRICIAKDIAGTQSDIRIDVLEGLVGPPAESVGSPKQAVCICKIGARIDGAPECSDCLKIAPVRECDEAIRKVSPGFRYDISIFRI